MIELQYEEEAELPDVMGVPSAQLQAVFEEYLDTDPEMFAERIGMDYNYLVRLCIKPAQPVVRLSIADKILDGLDQSLAHLEGLGEITVVPLNKSRTAAQRMADDQIAGLRDTLEDTGEVWIGDKLVTAEDAASMGVFSEDWRSELTASLMAKFGEHCGVLTDRQERERERARERMAKLRAKRKGGS